jgi:PAS domain S-box-containing protein
LSAAPGQGGVALPMARAYGPAVTVDLDQRFYSLAAQTGKLVYEYDVATGHITWSGAIEALTGYRPAELAAVDIDRWAELIHPDDRAGALALLEQAQRDCASYSVEYRFARKDGSYFIVEDLGAFLPDERGVAALMIGTMGDITARRAAERSLKTSEERYRRFVQLTAEGVWRLDVIPPVDTRLPVAEQARQILDHTVLAECNDAFVRHFGFAAADQLIGRRLRDLMAGGEADKLALIAQLAAAGYRLDDFEVAGERADGRRFFTLNNIVGIREGDALVAGWGTLRDVTAKRLAELERVRLVAVIENTSDLVGIAEPSGRPIFINRAGRRLLGLPDEGPLEADTIAAYHPRWAADVVTLEAIPAAIAHGQWQGETAMLHRDGGEIPVSQVLVAHRDAFGELAYLSTIVRDERERLAAEAERARLEAQLTYAHKMEALGSLAAGLSHDFTNVLTAIGAHVDLIARGGMSPDEVRDAAVEVRGAIRRASELVRRLLAFSRSDQPERVRLALGPVLAEAVRLLRAGLPPAISLEVSLGGALPEVEVDPGQLHQVLLNLVTNARLAIGDGPGTITVALRAVELSPDRAAEIGGLRAGGHLELRVCDDGCGMDEATSARIFEPFFSTRSREQGSGMGLAMVHGIVKAHGGAVEVRSEPGHGSAFEVYLPIAATATAPAGWDIVLVDDELPALRAVGALLESFGHRVEAHGDPQQAIAALTARAAPPDLLITDLAMPHTSGTELIEAVRRRWPALPAILCTGAYSEQAARVVERLGVSEVLLKPLDPERLEAAVGAALGRRAAPGAAGDGLAR